MSSSIGCLGIVARLVRADLCYGWCSWCGWCERCVGTNDLLHATNESFANYYVLIQNPCNNIIWWLLSTM